MVIIKLLLNHYPINYNNRHKDTKNNNPHDDPDAHNNNPYYDNKEIRYNNTFFSAFQF